MAKTVTRFANEMADREAIRDCLTRYGRGIDRCDKALLATVFWPDGHVEFETFHDGPVPDYVTKANQAMSGAMEQTHHMLGNMLIDIDSDGNTASCESYVVAFHRLPGDQGPHDLLLGGRYLDTLAKRNDEWRILNRTFVADWFRDHADSGDWAAGFFGLRMTPGGRFPADRSYGLFKGEHQ